MRFVVLTLLSALSCSSRTGISPEPLRLRCQDFAVEADPANAAVRVQADLLLERGSAPLRTFHLYLTSAAELEDLESKQIRLSWQPAPSLIPFFNAVCVSPVTLPPAGSTFSIRLRYRLVQKIKQSGLGALSMSLGPGVMYLFEAWTPSLEPLLDQNGFVRKITKAPFSLTVEVPRGYVALSVGVRAERSSQGAKIRFVYRSQGPPPMLLPLVIGRLVRTDFSDLRLPIELYSRSVEGESARPLCRFLATAAARQAELLGQSPPSLLRVALVDTGGLARGFPGFLVLPPSFSFLCRDESVQATICHELAHRYFGNLVTAYGPGGNEFLSEGMASYIGIKMVGLLQGPEAERRLWHSWREAFFQSETQDVPIVQVRPMQNVLSGEVYRKGALVLNELSRFIGQEKLWEVLRTFLKRYAGSYATCKDFETVATACSGKGLRDFFRQYLASTRLPFVSLVSFSCKKQEAGKWLTTLTLQNKGDGFGLVPVELVGSGGGSKQRRLLSFFIDAGERKSFTAATPWPVKQCIVDPEGTFLHGVRRVSLLSTAKDLRKKGRLEEARALYDRLLRLLPEDGEAWYGLGRLEEQAGDNARAIKCYRKAAAHPNVEWLPTWAWLRQARCLRKSGREKEAEILFKKVLKEGRDLYGAFEEARKALAEGER